MSSNPDRRKFLQQSVLAGAGFLLAADGAMARAYQANNKLNIGVVGVAGRGGDNLQGVGDQNIVALCDIDDNNVARASKQFLVGGRRHDQSMQLLDRPVVVHEPVRQPIEQFWVRGPGAHRAKVVGRRHDPFAEMLLPDSVDDDAGRERVFWAGDPFGERQAAAIRRIGDGVPRSGLFQIVGAHHRAQQTRLRHIKR